MREEHHQVAAKRHTLLSILKESASNVLSNMQRDQNEVDGTPELEIECRIGRLKQLWRRDGEASAPRIEGFSPSDHTRIETTVERRLGSTVWVLSSDRTKRNRVCFESSVTPAEFRHLRDALAAEGDVVRTGSVTTDYKYPNNRRIIHDHETNIMDQQTKAKKKNHVLDLYCPECKIDLRFAFALEKTESLKIDQVRSGFDYVRHKFRESFIRPSQSKFIRIDLTHVRSFRVPLSSRSGDSARHIVEEFVRESNLECSAAPSTATANAKGSTTHGFRVEITYEIEIEILWTTLCESVPKEGSRDRGFKRAREELDAVVTSLDPEKLIQTRRSEDGHHELGPLDSKNVAHPPQWRSSDCELRLERVVHAACGDLLQTVDWMCGVLGEFQSLGSGK